GVPMDYDAQKVSKIVADDFAAIHALDTRCFGCERGTFLHGWLTMPQSFAFKYADGSDLKGYGVIRQCRSGFKIGPLFADSLAVADELFRAFSSRAVGEPIYLDIPEI